MIISAGFEPNFAWLKQRPLCFLVFGFGSGLASVVPGTFDTLPTLPIAFIPCLLGVTGWWLTVLCVVLFFQGVRICNHAKKGPDIQDYGGVVWDEIVAMPLMLALVPFRWKWWLAALVLFRVLDAIKPWPIEWFDARIYGGLGIMLDDIIATFFTLFVLNAVIQIS